MGNVRLCRVKTADDPFYIEAVGVNITTYEELCWYITRDPALLDDHIFHEDLVRFVAQELKLTALAQTMEKALAEEDMAGFFLPILKEDGYLSQNEYQAFSRRFTALLSEDKAVRAKKRADALVGAERLAGAIALYREILKEEGRYEAVFTAAVCHNMGVAYARLFQYREAAAAFERAYDLARTKAYLKALLFALALSIPKEKYDERVKELGVDRETQREVMEEVLKASSEVPEGEAEDRETYLAELTGRYHRAADV